MPTESTTTRSDDEWSARLPATLAECAERWSLVIGKRLSGGLIGHVFACTTETGAAAVLKLNPPSAAKFASTTEQEAAALRAWGGRGAVELLALAADLPALLTTRALPGTPLSEGHELQARREVADVLGKLFDASIPPIELRRLEQAVDQHLLRKAAVSGEARELLEPLIEQARVSAKRLATSSPYEMLLHGDVMDKNLLRDGARLVAIDPMPQVGDPHSDIGFWAAKRSPARELDVRAAELAQHLGLDSERAAQWAAIYAVGSACETWRRDTTELRAWVRSARARELLTA